MQIPYEALSPETLLPRAVHIVVVVYGKAYSSLLASIVLPNIGALIEEIPEHVRASSKVRIFTTEQDQSTIDNAEILPVLQKKIHVEILNTLRMEGFEKHGGYGPMVMTQREAVIDAGRENAALFFVGPDQIYSRGSFRKFIECFQQGHRLVVGPGVRIKRDAVRPILDAQIRASSDGTFALAPEDQTELFFRHWHPINDQFVMGSGKDIWWKAYIYYRPHPDELFIRFFQGPTLAAWPRGNQEDFDGFIDHNLSIACCKSAQEVYVVEDGLECLALDLTDDDRKDIQSLARFPRADLLKELFDHRAVNDLQLLYGLRSCRVHRGVREQAKTSKWYRDVEVAIDPLILLALAGRRVSGLLGKAVGSLIEVIILLNVNTFCFLLGPFRCWLLRKKRSVLRSS